ncbi:unnamed protein product [Urochloa humidicola]
MGAGKENQHVDKGYYPHATPHSAISYTSPPLAYPYPHAQHVPIYHPQSSSYPYSPPIYSPHSVYPPSGYPSHIQNVYPPMSGHPGASPYAPQYHGHGSSNMGGMLAGGAAVAAAAAYGVHHLNHGHHGYGHHSGYFGKFKHHHHGHYGKFKHGKYGKHMRLGGKHGIFGWKHRHHGFFGGEYKRWK